MNLSKAFRHWPCDAKDTTNIVVGIGVVIPVCVLALLFGGYWALTAVTPVLWGEPPSGLMLKIYVFVGGAGWIQVVISSWKTVWDETFRQMRAANRFEEGVGISPQQWWAQSDHRRSGDAVR